MRRSLSAACVEGGRVVLGWFFRSGWPGKAVVYCRMVRGGASVVLACAVLVEVSVFTVGRCVFC